MDFGKKKYGHGVIINQNLDEYDNNWSQTITKMDWPKMMLEEALDGMVYTSAEIIKNGGLDAPHSGHLAITLHCLSSSAKAMLEYIKLKEVV